MGKSKTASNRSRTPHSTKFLDYIAQNWGEMENGEIKQGPMPDVAARRRAAPDKKVPSARRGAAATLSGERLVWFGGLPVRDGPEARVPLAPTSSSSAGGVGWCEASAAGCARLADPQ